MSVGDVIKRERLRLRLTYDEVGYAVDRVGTCVCNWERGRGYPHITSVPKMCKRLNITPNQLFEWDESEPKNDEELINEIQMLIARRRGKREN